MQELRGIRVFPLHLKQDVKGSGARGRNRHGMSVLSETQFLARLRTIAVDEVAAAHPFLALRLDFEQCERSPAVASGKQEFVLNPEFSLGQAAFPDHRCVHELQNLPAEGGKRPGPWLKTTPAVRDFGGREMEIDASIFLLQDGCQTGLGMVLRTPLDRAIFETAQSFNHEFGAHPGQRRRQAHGRIVEANGRRLLQKYVPGVQAGVDAHGSNPGLTLAARNSPLNGGGSAVLGQQGSVQIDVAQRRKVCQAAAKLLVVLNLFRLCNPQAQLESLLLHRRSSEFEAASPRPVGLRRDQADCEFRRGQPFERRHRESGGSAEDEIERLRHGIMVINAAMIQEFYHSPALASLRILRLMRSRLRALIWLIYSLPFK